jgi:hypothetical protein
MQLPWYAPSCCCPAFAIDAAEWRLRDATATSTWRKIDVETLRMSFSNEVKPCKTLSLFSNRFLKSCRPQTKGTAVALIIFSSLND